MAQQGNATHLSEPTRDPAACSTSLERLLRQFCQTRVNETYERMQRKLDSLYQMHLSHPGELGAYTVNLVNRTKHDLGSYHDFIKRGSPGPVLDFAKQVVDNRYKDLLRLVALDAKRCFDREIVRERPDLAHWQEHCAETAYRDAVIRYLEGVQTFMRCSGRPLDEEHRDTARIFCTRPWPEVRALVEADVYTIGMGWSNATPFVGLFRHLIERNPDWTLVSLIRAVRVAAADEVQRQARWHQNLATRLETERRRRREEEDRRRREEERNIRVAEWHAEQLEEIRASSAAAGPCVLGRLMEGLTTDEVDRLDGVPSHDPVAPPAVQAERLDRGNRPIPELLIRDCRTDLEEPEAPPPSRADDVANEFSPEDWERVDSDVSSFVL